MSGYIFGLDHAGVWADAKKGNHWPRRMGYHGSVGNGAGRALEQLPPQHQPRTHMDDIRKLLAARGEPETVALNLAQAKCRLFPDLDRPTIYREYGIGGDGPE
jgi:hypothetical protein